MKPWFLSAILFLASASSAGQSLGQYSKHVTITGNSIAHFQANFGPYEFPAIQQSGVFIWGEDGQTCAEVLTLILYLVPAQTDVAVLIDSTNDIRDSVPVAQHMNCMYETISALLARNPGLKIVAANTPPWTHYNPCTGEDNPDSILNLIAVYNEAYSDHSSGLQATWPNNVRVADVWTPSAGADGWAIPADMPGPCGIHPGQEFQWATSWSHFASPYEALVMQAVRGLW